MQSIRSFYDNGHVFITGGTGFLGKVVIEKLLRSCPSLQQIYILMRAKKMEDVETRFAEFQKQSVFDRIRLECPGVLSKITIIRGEIGPAGLQISAKDEMILTQKVTVVFHGAATIKFNEDLKDAADLNTIGTLRVMEFCTRLARLKGVVHVSTAFCNPSASLTIQESVYGTSGSLSKESFLTLVQSLPSSCLNKISAGIQDDHPNTYTLTKLMAERVVADFSDRLPLCIVRPSIIFSAMSEPVPGWIDDHTGNAAFVAAVAQGLFRNIICDGKGTADVVPVDIVANTMIAAAWSISKADDPIKVIHCTSGEINRFLWSDFRDLVVKYARENPTMKAMVYPKLSYRTNRMIHLAATWLELSLPANIVALFVSDQRRTRILKIVKRIAEFTLAIEYFTTHNFRFEVNNMRTLIDLVKRASDCHEFNCDISELNWSDYVRDFLLGVRRFVLRDGDESMDLARKKVIRLYWILRTGQLAILFLIGYILTKIAF